MANRFPLIGNSVTRRLEELVAGDNINLSQSGIYDGSSAGTLGQVLKSTGNAVVWEDLSITLTNEQVQDAFSALLTSNTETNISVTYDDTNNALNFVANAYAISATDGTTNKKIIRLTQSGTASATDDVTLAGGNGISLTRSNDEITFTGATYVISAEDGTAGKKIIRLTGLDSLSTTDDITLAPGTNVTLARTGDEITINANNTDTTYSVSAVDGGTASKKIIRLTAGGSGTGTDDVTLVAGDNISLSRTNDEITITGAGGTASVQQIVGDMVSGNSETGGIAVTYDGTNKKLDFSVPTWILAGSTTTTNHVLFSTNGGTDKIEIAGSGATSVAWDSVNKKVTLSSTDTNTTYSVSAADGTAGKKIVRLTAGGSGSGTDDVTFVAGTNVSLARTNDEITINSSFTDTNTTYGISAETATGGVNFRLTGSDAATDDVKFVAASANLTITRTDANTITFDAITQGAGADGNTTYSISAVDGADASKKLIRLTSANPSGTDDVTLVAGSNITLTRTNDEITIASQAALSRNTLAGATSSLAADATGTINITGYKSYALFKIQTSAAAWVRLYTDASSRTADASRSEGNDPLPGSGVIAEARTNGAETVLITPGTIGFNNDSTVSDTIYVAVTNRSGTTQTITVTLTALRLEV
jgi:hypothetical protein